MSRTGWNDLHLHVRRAVIALLPAQEKEVNIEELAGRIADSVVRRCQDDGLDVTPTYR